MRTERSIQGVVLLAAGCLLVGCGGNKGPAPTDSTSSAMAPTAVAPDTTEAADSDESPAVQAELAREATVTSDSARAIALREAPGGSITEGGLEREGGKLIWSFDITVPGKTGNDEVNIDAMTGKVLAHTHESPDDEAHEGKDTSDAHDPGGQS
jgi:uncharacterized membrane protein YkoI